MVGKVILVGVGGFGASHLSSIRRQHNEGLLELIGLVDPFVKAKVEAGTVPAPDAAPLFDTLKDAIEAVGRPDAVVAAVPIHLHAAIAAEALRSGADVLLEKPPFARMADLEAILELEKETGRIVQIAFQSLGSQVLDAFASGAIDIGKIQAVRAKGNWLRRRAYWERSPWVGRRNIGDIEVTDGVATNSLAHAVITALRIAGINYAEDVDKVQVEAYRANVIDSDDTTSLRVTSASGKPTVTAALTLCASVQTEPVVEVVGEHGIVTFNYTTDDVEIKTTNGSQVQHYGRVNLLENLLAHRENGTALRVPLRSTGAFMRVAEAIRTSAEPVHIERRWVERRGEGLESHLVVQDVEKWIDAATSSDKLFSEVGAPWAFTGRDVVLARGKVDGRTVFDILDGAGTTATSSPRPYIHPIRTLGGIQVTATHPADHDWHLGFGFAIPDVDGTSFWGGGTFISGRGYVLLDNHGTMTTDRIEQLPANAGAHSEQSGLDHTILWKDKAGRLVINEIRSLRWSSLFNKTHPEASSKGWELSMVSSLTAVDGPVSLGSPGTNGRENAGYGGIFWRLPRCSDVSILSADAEGEDNVHGSLSSWLSWSAYFEGGPGISGEATLIFVQDDHVSPSDPWIVRNKSYPGVGSAIAWKERVPIPANSTVSRGMRIVLLDGRPDRATIAEIAEGIRARIDN